MSTMKNNDNKNGYNTGLAPRGSPCTYSQEAWVPEGTTLNDNVVCGGLKGDEE